MDESFIESVSVNRQAVRLRSAVTIAGLPLFDIAFGPDVERGEVRGNAVGFIAMGDIATGVVAVGGMARGVIAMGGLALGLLSVGGLSIGGLMACGGLAVGGIACGGVALGAVALGGAAIGYVACGGAALGYYAVGGAAFGVHVLSPLTQDPETLHLVQDWIPGLENMLDAPPAERE